MELASLFLIGVHESLMEADRSVGSYTAITVAAIVRHQILHLLREDVLGAYLKNAGASFVGEGQHGSEVQIVSEYDVLIGPRPDHDLGVPSGWVTNARPVHNIPAVRF